MIMFDILKRIWRKLTHTNALDQSSGELETAFFETAYRVIYAAGSNYYIRQFLTEEIRIKICESLVFSKLNYGDLVYGPRLTAKAARLVQRIQNACCLSTVDNIFSYLMYSSMLKFLFALLLIGEFWLLLSETLSLDDIASSINVQVIRMVAIYKLKNMMDHRDVYKQIAKSMESPYFDISTVGRRRLVKYWVDTHERCLKLLLFLGNCTLIVWHVYPLVDEIDYNLVVGVRLPFRYDTPIRYAATYVVSCVALHYVATFVMVTDLIMQAHMMPLICQLVVLSDCLANITEDCKQGIEDCKDLAKNKNFTARYLRTLRNYVEQHKLILSHTMNLRAILSGPLLGQLGGSGILICFIGYQATTTIMENLSKCLMSLLYLSYNMFVLYIVCRWCEEITIQSHNVGTAIYNSKWETGLSILPGVRSTIMLIIARANKPMVFTAGGMYDLSLQAYTNLVKASYSALTVVLRFRSE